MIKHVVRTIALVFVVTLTAVWLLAPPRAVPARFGPEDCRRVALHEPETGKPIVGAEDMALLGDGDTLILAAHDRRDPAMPDGGLYRLSLWLLGASDTTRPVVLGGPGGSFRPHGFAVTPDGTRLALINRPAKGAVEILSGPLTRSAWRFRDRIAAPELCRANDLIFNRQGTLELTLDRMDCGPSIRDLSPWGATGRRMSVQDGKLTMQQQGLSFANGLLPGVVAETRAHRLRVAGGAIDVPGGPDNLTRTEDGRIIAALHPKLFLTMLGLSGWLDRIPSRIVAADPKTGAVEVLFDDPMGDLYSGATVAILAGGRLIAGSAIDRGILVCGGRT